MHKLRSMIRAGADLLDYAYPLDPVRLRIPLVAFEQHTSSESAHLVPPILLNFAQSTASCSLTLPQFASPFPLHLNLA